ncbi:MAG TPA: hypothetical protein VEK80_15140 [Kribbellaceae bacterium]|nr:hypothetical protein [Kribbellaceae bacterium]
MRIASDPLPTQWQVTLNDGSILGIWAGVYGEERGHYVFSVVADATDRERYDPSLRITGEVPAQPRRIMFAVARIPVTSVTEIRAAAWADALGRRRTSKPPKAP